MKGKRKQGRPKKMPEDASGEGEQEGWFGEKGCYESSEIESGSWRELLQKWGKSDHPVLRGQTQIKIGLD